MKVLLANKFYYRRGGDCIFTMNLERLLRAHGHEVAVFAMQYPKNDDSVWSKYWPSEMTKIKAFTRPFGDREVKKCFTKILDDFCPDVVHLNNIHTQLSPILAEIAHDRGVRVVWTLHDSKLSCPCYTCQRNGQWCEKCFSDKWAVVKYRCMPGGVIGSAIGYFELRKWNKDRLQAVTDMFLPPSQFMKNVAVKSGYDDAKFSVLCNFVDEEKVANPNFNKENYYCYLGRVAEIKGIKTLCDVASKLPYKLKVIGDGELLETLNAKYLGIEFLGNLGWTELRPVLEKAKFMVLPSECSENNPLSVIEAQSLGTPVLGARIGGITELIDAGVSGLTFTSGDKNDLREKIVEMWNATFDYQAIATTAVNRYSSEAYYDKLIKIYKGNR